MHISILTLFPEVFKPLISSSIIGRAIKKNIVQIHLINMRDFAIDKHKSVDDKPFGGGIGMIIRIDIIDNAIKFAKREIRKIYNKTKFTEKIIILDPKGTLYNQEKAISFTNIDHLILICGHYEGVDERIKYFIDESISIGNYIVTGGELPALVITDSVIRLLPSVLSKEAIQNESHSFGIKSEWPQYTRPFIYKKHKVPQILISGNHGKIREWKVKNTH